MGDAVLLATLVAFFGLAVLFVRGCDRIIGLEKAADRPGDEDRPAAGTEMAA